MYGLFLFKKYQMTEPKEEYYWRIRKEEEEAIRYFEIQNEIIEKAQETLNQTITLLRMINYDIDLAVEESIVVAEENVKKSCKK